MDFALHTTFLPPLAASVPSLEPRVLVTLILQLALLIFASRLLAELFKRFDQPAVLGELLAGMILGPSILGTIWPQAEAVLFPKDPSQPVHMNLLEAFAWISMILLVFLTGLETDLRMAWRSSRTALSISLFGLIFPCVLGFGLGLMVPDNLLIDKDQRVLFAAFLATTMTITALPVLAKILLDLGLLKRNVGIIAISAGVADDTVGWVVLSLLGGVATLGYFEWPAFWRVAGLGALFLVGCPILIFPFIRRVLKFVDDKKLLPGSDLAVLLTFGFVMAAITDRIGLHPLLGAFIAGCMVKLCPRLNPRSVEHLEAVVNAYFSPIFFGFVGVKLNMSEFHNWGLAAAVIGVAVAGKLLGCTLGGLLAGLDRREALAVGVGMNARGAMGLVAALIGLTLHVFSEEMYSLVVLMCVVTTLMTPPLLRWLASRIRISEQERVRFEDETSFQNFRKDRLKVLVPMAGGINAERALSLAAPMTRYQGSTLGILHVETGRGTNASDVFARAEVLAKAWQVVPQRRKESAAAPAEAIGAASVGSDVVMLGAAGTQRPLHEDALVAVLEQCRSHIVVLKGRGDAPHSYNNILVPSDGSPAAQLAFEFAAGYAEEVGARLTLLHVYETAAEKPRAQIPYSARPGGTEDLEQHAAALREGLTPLLRRLKVEVEVKVIEGDFVNSAIIHEAHAGDYDLVVLGAARRTLFGKLFLGHGAEFIVQEAPCTVAVVVPKA